ncbi:hypothetical protein B0J14DRAFT_598426 [Halenospora varia]|nr:hypothetical protein B0J14DRAFT_598426 [Halenospora varia]
MEHKRLSMPLDQETRTTPYESPIITLSVGPKEDNPVQFYVHKDKLIHIPFFRAALREDAFIEGRQNKIDFEEEDPILFRRVVAFIYEGDCFPRQKLSEESLGLEVPLVVRRTTLDSEEEEYNPSLSGGLSSGTYLTTTETHQQFVMVAQLLCLADRYGMEDFVKICFQKIKHFPIGTNEFLILAQYVVGSIPETRVDIHEFLADQVRLHLPRLSNCQTFKSLLESEMSPLGQGLMRLITRTAMSAQGRYIRKVLENDTKVAVCITDVTVEGCIEIYGRDDDYPVKFGAAKAGEVFVSDGTMDSRNIFRAQHVPDGPSLAFPASSFKMLIGTSFTAKQ